MGSMSWIHWVIVIAVIALLFGGRGKLSGIMGDAAKGIRAFKDGLKDDVSSEVADNKATGNMKLFDATLDCRPEDGTAGKCRVLPEHAQHGLAIRDRHCRAEGCDIPAPSPPRWSASGRPCRTHAS